MDGTVKHLRVKRLNATAMLPTRANPDDAGLDLYSNDHVVLWPGETTLVGTGVAVAVPRGYVGLVRDRSSVATKRDLKVTAGVIDCGYTGEVKVAFINLGPTPKYIKAGEKISQLLVLPIATPEIEEVETLESSARGGNGFGSSGT